MDDRGRPILSGLVSRDAGSFNDGGVQVGASQGGGPASMPSIVAGSPTPRGARLGAASVKEPASRDTSLGRTGPALAARAEPDRRLLDAVAAAFTAYEVPRLAALLVA